MKSTLKPLPNATEHQPHAQPKTKRVMTMVKNERMGGYVPKWETVLVEAHEKQNEPANAKERVEQQLSDAAKGIKGEERSPTLPPSEHAIAYAPQAIDGVAHNAVEDNAPYEPFGFGDLIDMANPLHHIPLVGAAYRELTGDTIKPIGHVIGGALFGGPIGLASGLVNAVVADSTGKSVEDHAKSFVFRKNSETVLAETKPVEREALPPQSAPKAIDDLPGTIISLADLKAPEQPVKHPGSSEPVSINLNVIEDYPFKLPPGSFHDL